MTPLYAHKFHSIEEMDQLFESHKLLKLSQDETDKQKSPVTTEEMDFMTLRLQEKKSRGPNGTSGDFYQTVQKEL